MGRDRDEKAWLGKQWRGMPGGTQWEAEKSSTCVVALLMMVGLPVLGVLQWLT